MLVRTAWASCTAVLLSLSLSTANGPAGGFFFARHQQRSTKLVAGQVQEPQLQLETPRSEERRGGRWYGFGRVGSTLVTTSSGGAEQEPRKASTEAAQQSYHESEKDEVRAVAVRGAAVEQGCQQGTQVGFDRQRKGLSSPLEALSSTRRQLGLQAWSTVAALGLREGRQSSATLLTRGGGGGGPQSAPPSTLPPPQEGDRFKNAIEGLKNGLASGLAAACVKTVLQPFDTMKTVQQFSTTRMTLLQAGRDLLARGGVPELYQGLGVTLVGSMPSVGVYFGLYQFVKNQMDGQKDMSPFISITVSAGVGNFIASFLRVPYEVVKQRLQVGQYPTTMVALQSIYREGGLLGFFGKAGLKMQWARDIPYAMVTLLVYETLQKAAARQKESGSGSRPPGKGAKANPIENMVIGAIAGGTGSLVTNPMDMIKTRMMTSPELYAGPMDAAWKAFSKEGPQAFLKGATPRLLHKIPANAFFFVAYEFFRNVLGVTR
eukprot:g3657.t1